MIHVQDIGKMGDERELIIADYRLKVGELGYDQTRHDGAVEALHKLGYDLHDARRWLATKAQQRR